MNPIVAIGTILLMDWLVFKLLFMPAFIKYKKIRQIAKSAPMVKGFIVDHVKKHSLEYGDMYAPVVRYTAHDGKEYIVESDDFGDRKKDIGTQVDVSYEAGNPSNAVVNPESQLGFKLSIMVFTVVIMIILNAAVIYKTL